MIEYVKNSLSDAQSALNRFLGDETNLRSVVDAAGLLVSSFRKSGKAFSCGNGGSMCDAMHFAEEFTGRFRSNRPGIAAIAISDPTHITCVANDYSRDTSKRTGVMAMFYSPLVRVGRVSQFSLLPGQRANLVCR